MKAYLGPKLKTRLNTRFCRQGWPRRPGQIGPSSGSLRDVNLAKLRHAAVLRQLGRDRLHAVGTEGDRTIMFSSMGGAVSFPCRRDAIRHRLEVRDLVASTIAVASLRTHPQRGEVGGSYAPPVISLCPSRSHTSAGAKPWPAPPSTLSLAGAQRSGSALRKRCGCSLRMVVSYCAAQPSGLSRWHRTRLVEPRRVSSTH